MAEQRSIEQIEASLNEWLPTWDHEGFYIYVNDGDVRGLIATIRSLRDTLADLAEYTMLMRTRIEQVDAPPAGGKE
jgi:hypothetical protein